MEILATIVTTTGVSAPVAVLFAFIIGAMMFYLIWYLLDFTTCKQDILIAAISSCAFAFFCGVIVFTAPKKEIVQYKVTIDETVSLVEFHKKYEIIDQEGKIYTIQERENND